MTLSSLGLTFDSTRGCMRGFVLTICCFYTHTCTFASDLYITQVLLFSKPTERKTDNACPILFNGLLPVHTQTHTHTRCTITTRCVWGGSCRCHWSAAGSLYEERWDGVMLESHCSIYGQAQFLDCPISDLWNHCYVHTFRIHTQWANFSSYRCVTFYPLDQIAGYLLWLGCLEMSFRQTGMMEG